MSDSGNSFTDVTTEGWGSRIGGSIVGMLFGFVLVPIAVFGLYWNEGRAVDASRALDQGAKQTVEASADSADPGNNGKLVHVTGALTTPSPARDPVFRVTGDGLVRLQRHVEMYQWEQSESTTTHDNIGGSKTTETTYSYRKTWADHPIDSSEFKHGSGHQNPDMPVKSATFESRTAKVGAYKLDPGVLSNLDAFTALQPDANSAPEGYKAEGDGYYMGDSPASPAVGDIKVSFKAVSAQTASVVAAQSGTTLTPYSGENGYTIALIKAGSASASELFKAKASEESTLTWILRGVGFAAMLFGFLFISSPLSTVLAVLPPLEWIAGAGAFLASFVISVPLTLIVIAIAWIIHRPLTGIILLVVAGGALFLFRTMHGKRAVQTA